MKRKITWLIATCLMALSLAMVSCATTPTASPTAAVKATAPAASAQPAATAAAPKPAASPAADKPQYGGTLISVLNGDPTNFDSGTKGQSGSAPLFGPVYEQYMNFDWTKGPAGGGPADSFVAGASSIEDYYYPQIAESWKMPSVGVWVLQIRKGVHWQKIDSEAGRLMGGRELTADDIVASLKRLLDSPQSWMDVGQPAAAKATTIEKTGPWEVTIKTPVDYLTSFFWVIQGGGFNAVYPQDVVAKYGDVADWHHAVGTGPFMLTDYTKGSSFSYVKNPDYWETDPVGPGKGNKLPYADAYKQLIIPDVSTRLAALRTGKVDMVTDATKEDAQSIIKDNASMKYLQYMTGAGSNSRYIVAMRNDKKDQPFSDKRVRQAMTLATDYQALNQTLFGGQGEIDNWPASKQLKSLYQPLSEMPQSVQDLFKYNPDKAKQLLAEAGYPNGFKASIVTENVPQLIDEVSLFKGMWAKVGIDLTIQPMETAAFNAMMNARSYDQLIYRTLTENVVTEMYFTHYRGASTNNPSFINDPPGSVPELESIFNQVNQNAFVDWPKVYATYKQMKPMLLENAYLIYRPWPYVYTMWWPWVKSYYGTQATGFLRYAWIDQDLKKSMGH